MEGNGSDLHQDKARRFRDAALPISTNVYTLARYLLRNTGDAEDAAQDAICARCAISTPFAAQRSNLGCSPSCATSAVANSRAGPAAYTTLINTLTAKRTRTRTLSDLCGRSRSSRQKQKCCTSGTHKQSAVSLQSFPTISGGDRPARNQRFVLSRDCRRGRCTGRNGDVAF